MARSERSSKRGGGRIWTLDPTDFVAVGSTGYVRPLPTIGQIGDFAYDPMLGHLWGPKSLKGNTSSPWPESPVGFLRPTRNIGAGQVPFGTSLVNGVNTAQVPNGSSEGDVMTKGQYLHQTDPTNTWNATAGGWRVRQFMYQQWGDTYSYANFHKGGSLTFTLKRLPDAGYEIDCGLGYQYGTMQPGLVIPSTGNIFWRNMAANNSTGLMSVVVGDKIYLSGVNGKYDLMVTRSGTIVGQATNFFADLGDYTLGGIAGLGMGNTWPSAAQAGCISFLKIVSGF
jgi:hypothetical protein